MTAGMGDFFTHSHDIEHSKDTNMATTINDYQPSGTDTIEVQFPGSKTRYQVKSSDSLTLGDLRRITAGDIEAFYDLFPEEARKELDKLHPQQLNDFIEAWTKNPKD